MHNKVGGTAFRIAGLVLGIVGTSVSVLAIVFSSLGMIMAKHAKREF